MLAEKLIENIKEPDHQFIIRLIGAYRVRTITLSKTTKKQRKNRINIINEPNFRFDRA